MAVPDNISEVVRAGRCCGCGVCAGVAPCATLAMRLAQEGVYIPSTADCAQCGACVSVCPGRQTRVDDIEGPLGAFLETFVGYSTVDQERSSGSSGGLATRVLKGLIARGEVEAVVAAAPTHVPSAMFAARVLRSQDAIDGASGSKYHPIEFSGALKELHSSGESFALIGLPCAISGVRLGGQRFRWLRDQCRHLIGLTCGHGVTTHYTTFLAVVSGVAPEDLRQVDYRHGPGPQGAADYTFVATRADGSEGRQLPFSSSGVPATVWGARLFTPAACFRCADLFAVDADLTLMDAWLPEYMDDRAGTSLAVVRSEQMLDLLDAERSAGRVNLVPIAPERVIASQRGALEHRRKAAALRKAESGIRRLPLRVRFESWWERLRSRLSNRLFAGGPLRRALGMRVILAWVTWHRSAVRLRTLVARLVRPARERVRLLLRAALHGDNTRS